MKSIIITMMAEDEDAKKLLDAWERNLDSVQYLKTLGIIDLKASSAKDIIWNTGSLQEMLENAIREERQRVAEILIEENGGAQNLMLYDLIKKIKG